MSAKEEGEDKHLATEICEAVAVVADVVAEVLPEPASALVEASGAALVPLCDLLEEALDRRDARRDEEASE